MNDPNPIRDWLDGLGLAQYADAFAREQIDAQSMVLLSEADLEKLGIPLGPRRKLLNAIESLGRHGAVMEPGEARAERRQITVMFCDLVGSTELSRRLDPEALRKLIHAFQDACSGAITRYEGYVAQFLGDGVLAYFGYPRALEAATERAIRAARAVLGRVAELHVGEQPLQVRIGIDAGLVVIGQSGPAGELDRTAVGDAPNLAARLQQLAEPGTIAVSERARRLAPGFDYVDLGERSLKGFPDPLRAWRVAAERATETRFEAATGGTPVPMVGRDHEFSRIWEAWQRAGAGQGQVVQVCGEAGIGKSRVVRALRDRLMDQGIRPWQYQCSPYFVNSALYPVIAHLERAFGLVRGDPPHARLHRLHEQLTTRFGGTDLDVNLLGRLFGLPAEERFGPLAMSPQKQKDETLRALVDLIASACSREPVAMLFEDIHWADHTTLEAIAETVRRAGGMRLLLVTTYRSEVAPGWRDTIGGTVLTLGRLAPEPAAAIVGNVAGGRTLPQEITRHIVDRTDGVPLFIEELTKAILESGLLADKGDRYELTGPLPQLAIPNTLRDSLMARLDRLATVKEVAQIGACIGREFSGRLVSLACDLDETKLAEALATLVSSGLVFRRGADSEPTYLFKHALIQDAARDSLLKSRRAEIHARIALALERHFPEHKTVEPELFAQHYTEAGVYEQAIPLWNKAGELALARMGLREAIAHLETGIGLIPSLPPSGRRDAMEVDAHTRLGTAWMALGGWFHPKVKEALGAAWEVAKRTEREDVYVPILWGLSMHTLTQGRCADSLYWVREMLELADRNGDELLEMVGHMAAVVCYFWYGDLVTARRHGDEIFRRYDPSVHGRVVTLTNHDPKTIAGIYASHWLWMLGYPDQAVRMTEEKNAHAARRGHPFDRAFAWTIGSWAYLYREEIEPLLEHLESAKRLGIEQSLPFFTDTQYPFCRGMGLAVAGDRDEAIGLIQDVLRRSGALGGEIAFPALRAYLARAYADKGEMVRALDVLDAALQQVGRSGWQEGAHVAEILRLKGEYLLGVQDVEAGEACLLRALSAARRQQAKSWELRAATSLARLWRERGKRREARELLAPVYGWFTEGFDTRDLTEARRVLESLA
jgi:class 3 adenylate cyclase/predicted ATPase